MIFYRKLTTPYSLITVTDKNINRRTHSGNITEFISFVDDHEIEWLIETYTQYLEEKKKHLAKLEKEKQIKIAEEKFYNSIEEL